MEHLKLKNGSQEPKLLVKATMVSIRSLMETDPIALYELVMVCRDREHESFGNTGDVLKKRSLLNAEGKVHNSIQNIVLSAVIGEGFEMEIDSPIT